MMDMGLHGTPKNDQNLQKVFLVQSLATFFLIRLPSRLSLQRHKFKEDMALGKLETYLDSSDLDT